MSVTAEENDSLEQDAAFEEPLRRIAYEAGMLLGLQATREEQAYHRRRLTRHQYWLHGAGTLAGMVVTTDPKGSDDPAKKETVRLLVSPGVGIDRLGRELLVHETYCINLGDWLQAQDEKTLLEGYSETEDLLWLRVSARYQDCPVGKQPVLARKLNLGTDPVQPSRTADSVLLDLDAELPPEPSGAEPFRPWNLHPAVSQELSDELTQEEQDTIESVSNAAARQQLELHARMLHALDARGVSTQVSTDELEDSARVLLARIVIRQVTDISDIIVNPLRMGVNNLVRPFLVTASQLAYLARQLP